MGNRKRGKEQRRAAPHCQRRPQVPRGGGLRFGGSHYRRIRGRGLGRHDAEISSRGVFSRHPGGLPETGAKNLWGVRGDSSCRPVPVKGGRAGRGSGRGRMDDGGLCLRRNFPPARVCRRRCCYFLWRVHHGCGSPADFGRSMVPPECASLSRFLGALGNFELFQVLP